MSAEQELISARQSGCERSAIHPVSKAAAVRGAWLCLPLRATPPSLRAVGAASVPLQVWDIGGGDDDLRNWGLGLEYSGLFAAFVFCFLLLRRKSERGER